LILSADISKTISYINRGVELGQPRLLQRAIRQNVFLRRNISKELLSEVLVKFIPSSCPTKPMMESAIQSLPNNATSDGEQEARLPVADIIPEVEVRPLHRSTTPDNPPSLSPSPSIHHRSICSL
jgi:hypothetical protein